MEARNTVRDTWIQNRQGPPEDAFLQNITDTHKKLRNWHVTNFSELERKLENCKLAVCFFDRIEEKRTLASHEFMLRKAIAKKTFELSAISEQRWKQRSRCNWLQKGDKNTRFFHVLASARASKNHVRVLKHQGIEVTSQLGIVELLKQHLQGILGTQKPKAVFNPLMLYPTPHMLSDLTAPFTTEEIEQALNQLGKNKASGPDGIPVEFLTSYWTHLKVQVIELVQKFYNMQLDLAQLNRANVIMIPKCEDPADLSQFRPISVLNIIPKLLAKILSNRLRHVLTTLIHENQTAFIKGRHIANNFAVVREILHDMASSGHQGVFLKIDFSKAFDSMHWEFLVEVMQARGFPSRWIKWITMLLQTASSRIIANGASSNYFQHKRGLRQRDPLSPMLFILGVNVLQRMLLVVEHMLPLPISQKLQRSIMALQYADDTAIIAAADDLTLVTIKMILRTFASISGLTINFAKSCFVPFNIP